MLNKNREFLDRRSTKSNQINDVSHNQSSMINTSEMDDVLSKVPFLNVQSIEDQENSSARIDEKKWKYVTKEPSTFGKSVMFQHLKN